MTRLDFNKYKALQAGIFAHKSDAAQKRIYQASFTAEFSSDRIF
jgi:hypothetical protein